MIKLVDVCYSFMRPLYRIGRNFKNFKDFFAKEFVVSAELIIADFYLGEASGIAIQHIPYYKYSRLLIYCALVLDVFIFEPRHFYV